MEWILRKASKEELEVLEWFGDAILEELTQRILILESTRMGVSLSPRLFNVLRDAFVTNSNLALAYERTFERDTERMSIKRRADRVEAYFGYLYVRYDTATSKKRKTNVRKRIDSLLADIMNVCDLSIAAEESSRASRGMNQFEILDQLDGTIILEEDDNEQEENDVGQILREKEWETKQIEDVNKRFLENLTFLLHHDEEDLLFKEEDSDVEEVGVETTTTTTTEVGKEITRPNRSVLVRYGRKLLSERISRHLFFSHLNKKHSSISPETLTRTRQDILSTKNVAELALRLVSSSLNECKTDRDKASILFRTCSESRLRNEFELIEQVTRELLLLKQYHDIKSHFQNVNMFPRALLCCSRVLKCYCSEWSMRPSKMEEDEEKKNTHRIGVSLAPLEIVVSSSSSSFSDRKKRRGPRKGRRRRKRKKRVKKKKEEEEEDTVGVRSCLSHFNRCKGRGEFIRLATSSTFRNLEILILLLGHCNLRSLSVKSIRDIATQMLSKDTLILSQVLDRLPDIRIRESCENWIELSMRDPMEFRMLNLLCSAHGAPTLVKSENSIRIFLTKQDDGKRRTSIGAVSLIRFVMEAVS